MVILRHIHLSGLRTFSYAARLQEILVGKFLRHKAAISRSSAAASSACEVQVRKPPLLPQPPPTILTFSPHPIYTSGRRETNPPTRQELQDLQRPLDTRPESVAAQFSTTLRGGQITFHGPGQLVIYPIISLSHPYSFRGDTNTDTSGHHDKRQVKLSARSYVGLLESSTIGTLAAYGVQGVRTDNPGVWVDDETKIAALGVHLRRMVTSHGVGLNIDTDLRWFDRIVACGLGGKRMTSMRKEMAGKIRGEGRQLPAESSSVEEVAEVWVRTFAKECGLEEGDVVRVEEKDILTENEDAI